MTERYIIKDFSEIVFQNLLPYTLATDIGRPRNEFNRITTEITPLRFKKDFFDPQIGGKL